MVEFWAFVQLNIYLICFNAGIICIFFMIIAYVLHTVIKQKKILHNYSIVIDETCSLLEKDLSDTALNRSQLSILQNRLDELEQKLGKSIPLSDVIQTVAAQNHLMQNSKLTILSAIKEHQIAFEKVASSLCFDTKEFKAIFPPTVAEIPEVKELMEKL